MVYCILTTVQSFDQLEVLDIARLETRAFVRKGAAGAGGGAPADVGLQRPDSADAAGGGGPLSQQCAASVSGRQVTVNPVRLPNRESLFQAVLMGRGFTVGTSGSGSTGTPDYLFLKCRNPFPPVWCGTSATRTR